MLSAEQRRKREEGILRSTLGATDEDLEAKRRMARYVFDEHGELITMLPGIGTLEEFNIGTYKKQFKAALKNPITRLARRGLDWLLRKDDTRHQMLRHAHALKLELGGGDWDRFYSNLLVGKHEQGLLIHLGETGEIDESYTKELASRTGWFFNRHPLPIYEVLVEQASKQGKINGGGLYKIILELRPGEFATFFAKKHAKNDEYQRTLKVQPLLARVTDKVSPILASDPHNGITVEKYIHGETLTNALKRSSWRTDFSYLTDPIEKAKAERSAREYNDKQRKEKLIPALDELIEISNTVEENRSWFKNLRVLGKDGTSFGDWFKQKYRPNTDELVSIIERNITSYLDSEDTVFCHGDAHTDNVIERLHKPHWIDWEFAGFSIPQWDVVKLLKRAGLSEKTEQEIVDHVCEKRNYEDRERFNLVYTKAKIFDRLASAAKYHKLSLDSRRHRPERQAQADIYFTDALEMIAADSTINEEEKTALVSALEKDAKGKFSRLTEEEYEKFAKELDPYANQSIENYGTPSIMAKYEQPPLTERLGKLWKKHKLKIAAGVLIAVGGLIGTKVYANQLEQQQRMLTKIERTNQYFGNLGRNDALMPFVEEYAGKYDNVNPEELAAVINAAYQYNKKVADFLLDYRQNPEPWARDAGAKKARELFKLKSGLSERQSFVKEENLEDPENNVFAAAKRLSDMKKLFPDITDAILAFYTSPEFVEKWKQGRSYWDYSKEQEFERDYPKEFGHNYKELTDRAIANLGK
ncbi:phosphotransferase [Candidatus Woesearchaeota archaeon]|nr:phosphotransferase [Candidatus Woesearchaeota archaeon]